MQVGRELSCEAWSVKVVRGVRIGAARMRLRAIR